MKRIIIAILLICILITSLVACNGETTTKAPANEPPTENSKLVKLNELAEKLDGDFVIDVKVSSSTGHIISEKHTITIDGGKRNVTSRIERINEFIVEGDVITVPDEYSTVTEKALSDEEIAQGNFEIPAFSFKSSNLSSVVSTKTQTTAKVNSIKSFLGISIIGSDAKITVNHTDSAISSIEISYVTPQSNNVTITYTFN